jgi:site-specific DNA-cytosine methylase
VGRRAIDLCCGAGGLSLGLVRAGFDVLGVEQDPDAVATHLAHVGPCEQADVTAWHPAGPVDLVAAGPPCQSFSDAGKRAGFDDPRGMLFAHALRVAVEARADAVLLENVRGFKRLALPVVTRALEHAGFVDWRATMLSARDYSVPQHRQRCFVVGFRDPRAAAAFAWPAPSHGAPGNLLGLPPWVTVREALGLGLYRKGRTEQAAAKGWWNGGRLLDVDAPGYTVSTRNNGDLLAALDPAEYCECGHWREEHRGCGGGCLWDGCVCDAWTARRDLPGLRAPSVLDAPAPTVVANAAHQGRPARPSQRPWTALADALDAPAPTVLTREHRSSVVPGRDGGTSSLRYAGDRLNAALAEALGDAGLLDRPATTILGSGTVAPAGHPDHVRTQVVNPQLEASGLLDRPATTVNTTNGIEPAGNHARQKRAVRLRIEHLAALQGAPEFVFVGDVESQHKQCGNMVPPALAAAVAGAVRAALDAADAAAEGRGAA